MLREMLISFDRRNCVEIWNVQIGQKNLLIWKCLTMHNLEAPVQNPMQNCAGSNNVEKPHDLE